MFLAVRTPRRTVGLVSHERTTGEAGIAATGSDHFGRAAVSYIKLGLQWKCILSSCNLENGS